MATQFDADDRIDLREVIARVEDLRQERDDWDYDDDGNRTARNWATDCAEGAEELAELEALLSELAGHVRHPPARPAPRRHAGSLTMDKGTLCFASGPANPFSGAPKGARLIELRQQGRNTFSVRYGLQMDTGLTYDRAAAALGEAIMHDACCEGAIRQGD